MATFIDNRNPFIFPPRGIILPTINTQALFPCFLYFCLTDCKSLVWWNVEKGLVWQESRCFIHLSKLKKTKMSFSLIKYDLKMWWFVHGEENSCSLSKADFPNITIKVHDFYKNSTFHVKLSFVKIVEIWKWSCTKLCVNKQ